MGTPGSFRTDAVLVFVLALGSAGAAQYSGGSGTGVDPYRIVTAADLIGLGETPADYDKHFVLSADLDLAPHLPGRSVFEKAVIAPTESADQGDFLGTSFTGVFDGAGHTIKNLRVAGGQYLGLFGCLGAAARVSNLRLEAVEVSGSGYFFGGLAACNYGGSVTQCGSTGAVSGGGIVGGLVGYNSGAVARCYSAGAVAGNTWVGGLVGYNAEGGTATSYSTAMVSGREGVGGLMGRNCGTVRRCYSAGPVAGAEWVGGLVGSNLNLWGPAATVSYSLWDIEISGQSGSVGGVGLTTAEMMDAHMLGLNGFADDPNWVFNAGQDYPRLAWEGSVGQAVPQPEIDWIAGQGTAQDPYLLQTADQLILIGKTSVLWDKHFALGADLDLDPALPGRRVFAQALIPVFTGVLDGRGHRLSNLTIEGGDGLGLFGNLRPPARILNVGVVDVSIAGSGACIGGLVGKNDGGDIANSHGTGVVCGTSSVGGLVGENVGGSITDCYSRGVVCGVWSVGGLVSANSGPITNSYSAGSVEGIDRVGGLVSANSGPITNSCSGASVRGTNDVGGLVGANNGPITNSYSDGPVDGAEYVGGLVGVNGGSIISSYSRGWVQGTDFTGGLVGHNGGLGSVLASFWDLQVSGWTISAGGTGQATAAMQRARTFLEAGWDFVGETANGTEDSWWIDEGKGYPHLWWEGPR